MGVGLLLPVTPSCSAGFPPWTLSRSWKKKGNRRRGRYHDRKEATWRALKESQTFLSGRGMFMTAPFIAPLSQFVNWGALNVCLQSGFMSISGRTLWLFKKSFRLKMVFNRVGPVCLELTAASSKIVLKVSKLEAENYNSFRMRCGMIVHIQHYLFYVTTRFIFLFTILLTLSCWTTLQHKISFSFSVDLKKIAHFYIFTWDYCVALNVMIFNTCLNKDRKWDCPSLTTNETHTNTQMHIHFFYWMIYMMCVCACETRERGRQVFLHIG